MEQFERLDKDEARFWRTYSDIYGQRLKFTKIVNAIRSNRALEDQEDVRKARLEYPGEAFIEHFSYIKSGARRIYQKDAQIARRYRELKGLSSEPNEEAET